MANPSSTQQTRARRTAGTAEASPGNGQAVTQLPGLPSLPMLKQLSLLRPQIKLPSKDRMVLYAGLGALAVFDVIEWPVAAAIAAAQVLGNASRDRSLLNEIRALRPAAPGGAAGSSD